MPQWVNQNWTSFFSWQIFFHLIGPLNFAYQTLAFSPIRKLELWRFFTYALLHAGPAHLVINIILQLVIAFPLESEVGHLSIVFVYVFGIFSGSLAASVSADFSFMVGASSGIYSLLMSHIPHIYMVSFKSFFLLWWFSILFTEFLNNFSSNPSNNFCHGFVNQWRNLRNYSLPWKQRTSDSSQKPYRWCLKRHFAWIHFLREPPPGKQGRGLEVQDPQTNLDGALLVFCITRHPF